MKTLVLKELKSIFCSSSGVFFSLVFLLVSGVVLWLFSGTYNFVDNGYADMSNFFWLSPVLLMVLIPALTMRLFAEEKRNNTFEILISRPLDFYEIYLSKFLSTFVFICIVLSTTIVYVYSLFILAYPEGNLDVVSIIAAYVSLLLLTAVFIVIGLFSSILTKNQAVAFIVALLVSILAFYGFDLLSNLFTSGKLQSIISSLGLSYHYNMMQKGVIQMSNLLVFVNYFILFLLIAFILYPYRGRMVCLCVIIMGILNVTFLFIPNVRFDCTNDKRYTLSEHTVDLLKSLDNDKKLVVDIFLTGELNKGFERLRKSVNNLLSDYMSIANADIYLKEINPYQIGDDADVYQLMVKEGMPGIVLNETDREGKISRKTIYPYVRFSDGVDTLVVSLLKNVQGNTAEENLNASIEGLEYEFTDAIRLLSEKESKSIAFIEGHDEISRVYLYDAEELLSKYYSIHRGQISNDIGELDNFDAIVIAGPLKKYTETEKYIIDQYIMGGGKVLWMLDGAFYSHQELMATGRSVSMKNELNLDDMLFTYGVRINPDLIQDKQCISTYLINDGDIQTSTLQPNYYQPILMPSPEHPVTHNIRDVKSGFVSSIDFITTSSPDVEKNVLLTSSGYTHLIKVPDMIDFDVEYIQNTPNYFNEQFIPVSASLEGHFNSAFVNRRIPDSMNINNHIKRDRSEKTKMIVVSSSDIITNEIQGQGETSQVLPMGYDRVSRIQYGNKDFILNAINWLTDDEGMMSLRAKRQQMYLLNKELAYKQRDKYAVINIGFPIIVMLIIMGSVYYYRKRKYEK